MFSHLGIEQGQAFHRISINQEGDHMDADWKHQSQERQGLEKPGY